MFCVAVISLVYSHVIEVCVFSSLSSFCSLRPALGGMQIDMRFSFDPFPVILCLCRGQEPTVLPRLETAALYALCFLHVHVVKLASSSMAAWDPLSGEFIVAS